MIDYCSILFSHSNALQLVLSQSFHDLYCHTPLVLHVFPQALVAF